MDDTHSTGVHSDRQLFDLRGRDLVPQKNLLLGLAQWERKGLETLLDRARTTTKSKVSGDSLEKRGFRVLGGVILGRVIRGCGVVFQKGISGVVVMYDVVVVAAAL
jgi:hypothetical protein